MREGCAREGCVREGCAREGCVREGCVREGCVSEGCVREGCVILNSRRGVVAKLEMFAAPFTCKCCLKSQCLKMLEGCAISL